ncbi:MAG: heptosyltransferase family [Sphingobacteriales bacterium]|nr:heptosyltransferase family [Sphingobacteriales bacterium]
MPFLRSAEYKLRYLLVRIVVPAIINSIYFFTSSQKKTLLIIKNDGIGDYVLFRNYIQFLRNSIKFKDYKIYLLTNPTCKDLVDHFDLNFIDGCFYYSDNYFLRWKLVELIFNLQKLRLQTIIYPNYSRKSNIDWLVNKLNSDEKIAIDGDTINQPQLLKEKGDKYYSKILRLNLTHLHEFERNKRIIEALTQEKCDFTRPFLNLDELNLEPNESVIIFPGGSESNKKWSASNYNSLCRMLILELNLKIILAGGNDDIEDGEIIQRGIRKTHILNKIAKLSLIELCELIAGAKLLISNDTVAIHIAATLNIPTVCIAKGDLYGRFVPYPKHIAPQTHCVFPPYLVPSHNQDKWSVLNINKVLPEKVFSTVISTLKHLTQN